MGSTPQVQRAMTTRTRNRLHIYRLVSFNAEATDTNRSAVPHSIHGHCALGGYRVWLPPVCLAGRGRHAGRPLRQARAVLRTARAWISLSCYLRFVSAGGATQQQWAEARSESWSVSRLPITLAKDHRR